jgi:hypothetical protein
MECYRKRTRRTQSKTKTATRTFILALMGYLGVKACKKQTFAQGISPALCQCAPKEGNCRQAESNTRHCRRSCGNGRPESGMKSEGGGLLHSPVPKSAHGHPDLCGILTRLDLGLPAEASISPPVPNCEGPGAPAMLPRDRGHPS